MGLAALSAMKAEPQAPEIPVPVFVDLNTESPVLLSRAKFIAGSILHRAGVRIVWCKSPSGQPGTIVISAAHPTPARFPAGALAAATPFGGTRIEIVYERVQEVPSYLRPTVLGHVLAHEITHMLQGMSRHSETGVMKASWKSSDYHAMYLHPYELSDEDIDLIRRGLQRRELNNRAVAASTPPRSDASTVQNDSRLRMEPARWKQVSHSKRPKSIGRKNARAIKHIVRKRNHHSHKKIYRRKIRLA
jgi:hypothetical protein